MYECIINISVLTTLYTNST